MMKPAVFFCFMYGCLIAGLFDSCKDIIEPNIKDKLVQTQAPGNNYQSTSYNINFWWDEVSDALTYRLEVVSPSFGAIGSLVLDTVVKTNKFSINLSPGNYEWRVKAQNGSSETVYSTTNSFNIVYSSIKTQKVQLLAPANNTLTNQGIATFSWNNLYGATKYQLEIDTNNFINENAVIYNQAIPGQQLSFTFPKDQIFQWRVRAENDTAQAQWSAINSITYDHTPPAKVTLLSPSNNQTISQPVNFQWNNTATASKYKLYVLKSDSTTLYNSAFPASVITTNYNFNVGSPGERVYWKVSAVDAAGNEGLVSQLRSFVLQ